eukprot:scaffold14885_cov65-Phaeocystis_antarctica.AAC.18
MLGANICDKALVVQFDELLKILLGLLHTHFIGACTALACESGERDVCGKMQCGTRGISHPRNGRVPEGASPTIRCAAGVPGGRWGSVVYGWRAPRPPRVVFVIGFASPINSLTSGKNFPYNHPPP